MVPERSSLIVFGRFPPPVDGQSLATKRFVSLIEDEFDIVRIDTNIESAASALAKMRHYFRSGTVLRRHVARHPDARIVWQSISPKPSGHLRDLLTVLPNLPSERTIAVAHWGIFDSLFKSSITKWTARLVARGASFIVFTTESLSEACSTWLPDEKRRVISNTIDDETICSEEEIERKLARASDGPFRILFLSNMMKEKGYMDLLAAARLLKASEHPVMFDFVGAWASDKDHTEFRQTVAEYELAEFVTHHGPVHDRSEIRRFHLNAHAFVLPSYNEAQPVSILEALSAATPIIASNRGGIPDMVRDGKEALLIPIRSPDAIFDAVVKLLTPERWLGMSLRARKRFLDTYHPDIIRARWVELLRLGQTQ